ncbi:MULTISPECIES: hypothetical protein [Desulfococcus]|jgi:predicted unusual protein kinase regulating ubiquinone biosynthesis (AarF/ABC1/UbiB family)|uniref:Uncharacterized protein n=1 Tax=Desulfococcus multivorans DSM 2059 TaxID=1121405 RepID=S7TDF0_DESML|nr:hypothetical protein [Desulfococcus multivorans]AOY60664.1 conserved uncharacterized protein [Desulfococcus multivorans]AQV02747.1 hypothetical protein B2D07_19545 [Desulfococcus multivorans]EPR34676.1 hypothetical protein dsmv_3248 [Desulfococcus multivorans DSM 2059]MDX9819138.1 hypothetical protein [Desulfococcus multivorans]SKA02676.1 hypothetical protein SAMN02745446_02457 [Desulfococcus multivorans DSM 2059]
MKKNDDDHIRISLPGANASDLRGKQSVRATFKLTEDAINTISIVSIHLGIKQKSLFDHLIEDINALETIAQEIEPREFNHQQRIQKTFVLSRKTLMSLEKVCRNFNAPRDILVEYSIQRLLPVIIREQERHRRRKEILKELEAFLRQGQQILEKSKHLLGDEDMVYDRLERMMGACTTTYEHVADYIERGKVIETFKIDSD